MGSAVWVPATLFFGSSSAHGRGMELSSVLQHMIQGRVSRAKERVLLDGPAPPLGLHQLPCTLEVSW